MSDKQDQNGQDISELFARIREMQAELDQLKLRLPNEEK